MKRNILFSFLLVIFTSCISYQYTYNTKDIPENGDNTITITTNKSDIENYNDFGKYLVDKGFTFESKDPEFKTYETNAKSINGTRAQFKFIVSFFDDKIRVRVRDNTLTFGSFEIVWIDWQYRKDAGSVHLNAFKEFFPILYEYNQNITFTKN